MPEKQQPQRKQSSETNYYNYGTVGFQGEMNGGNFSATPSKRMFEKTEENHAESPKSPQIVTLISDR